MFTPWFVLIPEGKAKGKKNTPKFVFIRYFSFLLKDYSHVLQAFYNGFILKDIYDVWFSMTMCTAKLAVKKSFSEVKEGNTNRRNVCEGEQSTESKHKELNG